MTCFSVVYELTVAPPAHLAMFFPPPLTRLADLDVQLKAQGHAVLDAASLSELSNTPSASFLAWNRCWDDLPLDGHLRDGGRYRRRRHSCFSVYPGSQGATGASVRLSPEPHRAHWQPLDYNALHGGIERWFEPMAAVMCGDPAWARLLVALAERGARLRGQPDARWAVEAHPFRIDTAEGIGRPTPEGAHRDGVDLVAVILVNRTNIKGGETRVFDAQGPQGLRFTLTEPWSALLLDDERVIHESTPIQPLSTLGANHTGHRDTLVLTFRLGGFQGPMADSAKL